MTMGGGAAHWTERLVVIFLMLLFLAFNFVWLWHFRHGQPLDIDEAGYISVALANYRSLLHGGLTGYIQSLFGPGIEAPVTGAAAALVFTVTGPHVLAAYAVPMLSGALCIAGTYAMARTLGMGRMALLPTLLVATCPLVINYSRDFQFAMTTTSVTTAALACLLRSRRLRRPGWSLLFGLFLGLIPLSRTMALAFLPALVVGVFVYVYFGERADRGRRSLWLAASLLVAAFVALSWFFPNAAGVFSYLMGYGYGGHAAEYSGGESRTGFVPLIFTLSQLANYICVPQFCVLLAGLLAGVVLFIAAVLRLGLRRAILAVLRHPACPLLAFIAGVVLALSSTANRGSGFIAPAVPAMLTLACLALQALSRARLYRRGLALLLVAVAIVSAVPTCGLPPFDEPVSMNMPIFGSVRLDTGDGSLRIYEVAAGYSTGNWAWPVSPAMGRAFGASNREIALALSGKNVAFGVRHVLLNVNTVMLEQRLLGVKLTSGVAQIDPVATGSTSGGVAYWLTKGGAGHACLLVLSDQAAHQFNPVIQPATVQAGAVQAGFVRSGTVWPLPDGEQFTLWRRPAPGC